MPSGEYLGQEEFQVALRPARVAYLVAADSDSGFRRAVQEATSRWGGRSEPIIPVQADGLIEPFWTQVFRCANVDGLVNVDIEIGLEGAISQDLGLPIVRLDLIDHSGPGQFTCHPSAVAAQAAGFSSGFEFKYGASTAGTAWQWIGADERLDLWTVAAGGCLVEQLVNEEVALGQPVRLTRDPLEIARAQIGNTTLVDRTIQQFAERWVRPVTSMSTMVWICGRENQLLECLLYWNRRALQPLRFASIPMILLPEWDLHHWLHFPNQVTSMFDGRPNTFEPDAMFVSLDVSHERLAEIAESWGMVVSAEEPRATIQSPPPPVRTKPYTYRTDLDPTPHLLFERRFGVTAKMPAQIFRNRTSVTFNSPVAFHHGGRVMASLSSEALGDLPRRQSVAMLVENNATWRDDAIEFATVTLPEYTFNLRIPSHKEVAAVLLQDCTNEWSLSDKGKIGESILAMPGGTEVRSPGVYAAAKQLTTKRTQHQIDELQAMEQSGEAFDPSVFAEQHGGGRLERMNLWAGNLSNVAAEFRVPALEQLVAWKWCERGFRLKCSQCLLTSFVPMREVTADAVCPGCGSRQHYDQSRTNLNVYYRLNSLIDRAVDQGVLPHLLAMEALFEHFGGAGYVLPGVNLEFSDGARAEVDLYGVLGAKVLSGEVKTSATEFTIAQVNRDIELAVRLDADVHVMACLEVPPEAVVEQARQLAEGSDIELLDFGPDELQP